MLIASVLVTAVHYFRSLPARVPVGPDRPDLIRWALPGCYQLETGPWSFGSGEIAEADVPEALVPPSRVLLVPDSFDVSHRSFTTYRAIPMAEPNHEALRRNLRWFVRADTLWLVWSDGYARAGIALFEEEEGFRGLGRAFSTADSLDGRMTAAAWKVNCATLLRATERAVLR